MKYGILFALTTGAVLGSLQAEESTLRTLEVDGRERSYLLHLPEGYNEDSETTYPVVLVFHGGGGNAGAMMKMTGMSEKADEAGFIAVYPNGTGNFAQFLTWNGGICCGYAMENGIDDVAFVSALLDVMESEYRSDPARVYATGLSNGGIVSYLIASELSLRITAIAPVGGTIGTERIAPDRPVPVMHLHGTGDAFLPMEGGYGKNRKTEFFSVDDSLRSWIFANDAEVVPVMQTLPDKAEDGCHVEVITYPAKKDRKSAEVVNVRIVNGGHTWPGSQQSPAMLGTVTQDINANDLIWDFFKKHRIE